MVGAERRRSMGGEDEEWGESEAESKKVLDGIQPEPKVESEAGPTDVPDASNLGIPEFEEPSDGYTADALISADAPAAAPAPTGEAVLPEGINAARRASLGQAERRRSMGGEDEEWVEAEKEQSDLVSAGQ